MLWPAVLEVAQQQLYSCVPKLLDLARNAGNADSLSAQIDESLTDQYSYFARAQQQLEQHEHAVELYSAALARSPRRIDVLEGRAESLAALGNQDKASADLAQAREFQERL